MDLFFSKLLPLVLYPLGLASVLLVVAIVVFWKRPRLAAIAVALSLTVLLIFGNYSFAHLLLRTLEYQNRPSYPLPNAAAIVVLGGSTKSALAPRPWVEVNERGDRVLYAAKLYREGKAPVLILSGGRIEWMGAGDSESEDMAKLITSMGVPATAILQDPVSQNTYENGVQVRQILQAQKITGPVLLVTSAFHMPRSLAIFKHLGIPAIAAPTDFLNTDDGERQGLLGFVINLFPTANALEESTVAIKEYLGLLTYRLRGWL